MTLCSGERFFAMLVAVVLVFAGASVRADADDDPPDVVTASAVGLELPPLPQGFVRKRIGDVEWGFHERDAELAFRLQDKLAQSWRRVTGELGRKVAGQLTIRIARGPEDMLRLAPRNNPPPPYAVGVAYPSLGLILLSVVSPDSWFPPDQGSVLTHELSHVALHRAVDGRPLPLWFVEGLAAYQAGEHRLSRVRTLWEATVAGDVLPLELVSRNFPSRPNAVNLAYAESADLVRHLLQSSADHSRLSHLLVQVAAGAGFEQALLSAYRIDLSFLEREWRQGLNERFRVLPLVLTGTALWGGIALLAIAAFVRRRQQDKEKLARWEVEEGSEPERPRGVAKTQAVPAPAITVSEPRTIHVYALPPPVREAGVPTVEHDGQRHTLH